MWWWACSISTKPLIYRPSSMSACARRIVPQQQLILHWLSLQGSIIQILPLSSPLSFPLTFTSLLFAQFLTSFKSSLHLFLPLPVSFPFFLFYISSSVLIQPCDIAIRQSTSRHNLTLTTKDLPDEKQLSFLLLLYLIFLLFSCH